MSKEQWYEKELHRLTEENKSLSVIITADWKKYCREFKEKWGLGLVKEIKEVYVMFDPDQGFFKEDITFGADGWVDNPFTATHWETPKSKGWMSADENNNQRLTYLWKDAKCMKVSMVYKMEVVGETRK